jgi:hypothetical protein
MMHAGARSVPRIVLHSNMLHGLIGRSNTASRAGLSEVSSVPSIAPWEGSNITLDNVFGPR